jgi:AraC-like DNA-binding protein
MYFKDLIQLRLLLGDWTVLRSSTWVRVRNIRSPFWRLYYNEKPGTLLETSSGKYHMRSNEVYLIPKWTLFSGYCLKDTGHFYLHFDILGLSNVSLQEYFYKPLNPKFSKQWKVKIHEMIAALRAKEPNTPKLYCEMSSIIFHALGMVFKTMPSEWISRMFFSDNLSRPILPAIEYIDRNFASPLKIRDLSKLCHMSEDYFIRTFRRHLGRTPILFIQEKRVQQAAQLLLTTNHSIDQIAEKCGFGNRFYFGRVFKKHARISPANFRSAEIN